MCSVRFVFSGWRGGRGVWDSVCTQPDQSCLISRRDTMEVSLVPGFFFFFWWGGGGGGGGGGYGF